MNIQRLIRYTVLLLVLVILTGCAAKQAYKTGQREMRRHDYDRAVLSYSKAVAMDPGNSRFKVALARAKVNSSAEHFRKGERYLSSEQLELAIAEFQQTLLLDPGNQHATNETAMPRLRNSKSPSPAR